MNPLLLATEGVEGLSPDHIAADLAVPIGILIFGGAMFALLWSNFGARKGALILGVAMFGFMGFIGVFWWFGAPGTPVATGLQNFPGQPGDAYLPQWYPFEAGSERSEFFDADETFAVGEDGEITLGEFQRLSEFVGTTDIEDPLYASISGDLEGVAGLMIEQFFPRNDFGGLNIGAGFRTELQEATAEIDVSQLENAGEDPTFFAYTAQLAQDADGNSQVFITEDQGQRMAAAKLEVVAEFRNADGTTAGTAVVATTEWFAFKDPGALWLPSAVWTVLSFLLFGLCLALLDRIEQREKEEEVEVEEAMDVQVPIKQ
jgi:hypothetical protein